MHEGGDYRRGARPAWPHVQTALWRHSTAGVGWLAVALLLLSAWRGFVPHITDQHSFRQAQTAMVAQYLRGLGDLFTYELPVLGAPWAVPFEVPVYQAFAKAVHAGVGLDLVTSGRVVGVGFFLMALACLVRLCRQFDVRHPALACALAAVSPLYVFWSRSFMIETTALAFMLWFATVYVDVYRDRGVTFARTGWLMLAGIAAVLTKVTTLLPVLALTLALQGVKVWRSRHEHAGLALAAMPLVAQGVVLAIGAAWVSYSDVVKSQNPLAQGLTSHHLKSWNWGTLGQRMDPQAWLMLLKRSAEIFFPIEAVGSSARSLALFMGLLLAMGWATWCCTAQRRRLVALNLALFLAAYLCFTNLHIVHNYYQCANAVFLVFALGLAFEGAISQASSDRQAWLRLAGYLCGLLLCAACAYRLVDYYAAKPERNVAVAAQVRQAVEPGKAIIIAGQDWSPLTPYQSGHRALMLWDRSESRILAALGTALRQRGDYGLYLACGDAPLHDMLFRRTWGLDPGQAPLSEVNGCRLYRL